MSNIQGTLEEKERKEERKQEEAFKSLKLHPNVFHLQETHGILVSTMNDLPGHRIVKVLGTVYGMSVQSRNFFASIGAGFKTLVGGEIGAFTKMLYNSRNKAVERLIGEALAKGANAVVAMRFDQGSIGEISQVCAYGTACVIEKA